MFFSLEVAPLSGGNSFTRSGPAARGVWVFAAARGGGEFRNDDGGGFFCGWTGSRCGSGRLTTGERVKESPAVFVFPWSSGPLAREIPDIFRHGWRHAGKFRNDGGGRCCVYFDGCCGSMCWPVDRPGTHAAGGPAARGVWVFAAARGGGEFRNDGGLGVILSHAQEWVGCKYFFKLGPFPSFLCYNSSQQPPPLCAFNDAYGRAFLCLPK